MKRSVILTDRLGPDILSAFWTKGQVLHRERAHLKVESLSSRRFCHHGRQIAEEVWIDNGVFGAKF